MSKKNTNQGAGSSPKQRGPAPFVTDRNQVQSAIGQLVSQFSQKLAFLRELVQNSLDAGSNSIDVSVQFDPETGFNLITVSDTGDGMDRTAIDEKLTRLFSSSKENDLTKVGKFGVGFVSVFSCQPEAVVVDTGRNGESWRIIFHPDHSFDRLASDDHFEGTTVRVYLNASKHDLSSLQKEALATLSFWCKHCHCDIFYNGDKINQPFSLANSFNNRHLYQNLFEYYHESSLVRVCLAVADTNQPRLFQGFYNGGITLLETQSQKSVDGLHFKIDSRYLEHTVTRDQVEKDDNYHKSLQLVQTLLETSYIAELKKHLVNDPKIQHWKTLKSLLDQWPQLKSQFEEHPCWPVFTPNGEKRLASLKQLTSSGPCVQSQSRTLLVERMLEKQTQLVLKAPDELQFEALKALGVTVADVQDCYHLAELVSEEHRDDGLKRLQDCLQRLKPVLSPGNLISSLLVSSSSIKEIWLGRWTASSDAITPFLVSYPKPGQPMTKQQLEVTPATQIAMINIDHPISKKLVELVSKDAALAALWLSQRICLSAPPKLRDESQTAYKENLKFIQQLYEHYSRWESQSQEAKSS